MSLLFDNNKRVKSLTCRHSSPITKGYSFGGFSGNSWYRGVKAESFFYAHGSVWDFTEILP